MTHRIRRALSSLIALSFAVGLASAARADEGNALASVKPTTFGKFLSSSAQQKVTVSVPLVALKDAQVVMANYGELRRLGIAVPKNGLQGSFESDLVKSFAFRPATKEEIAAGQYTHTGIATRYADAYGADGVRGDGRAALTGEVIVRDRKGRVTGVFDIQVKGVGTGLHPNWKDDHAHSHGKETLRQALEDAIYSDYLSRNGLRTNRWLAVIDTKQSIDYPDGGKEHAGILVRGGNFLRLAHFNLVRDDPKALRELVDFANRQVSIELGRKRPLSIAGLYKVLTQRKAEELAQNWWLRTVHGSTTYDNIGLIENMDHGTTSTVDRTHPNFSFFSKWVGYGGEPGLVMQEYYGGEKAFLDSSGRYRTQAGLYSILRSVATPAERAALDKISPSRMPSGMLESQMTYQSLLHLGFSEKEAGKIMAKGRAAARSFYKTVAQLAAVTEFGATHQMGKIQVKDPARYDIFAAMNKLAELQVTRRTPEARAQALVKALRPGASNDQDLAAARRLVDAYDKVAAPILGRVDKREAIGRVRMWREAATDRNFFAAGLVRQDLREYAGNIVGRVQRGEHLETIRADISSFMRNNLAGGRGSSLDAAARVIAGTADRTADKRLVLSSYRENGVSIRELSDGKRDVIEVRVAGDPLGLGNLNRYRMRFDTGKGFTSGQADYWPLRQEAGEVVFEIPVTPGRAPKGISAVFYDAEGKASRWWNNGGRNFGGGHRLVLGSANVQTALALEASRQGGARTGVRSSLAAVAKGLFAAEKGRRPAAQAPVQLPRHQRALVRTADKDGAAAVRSFQLRQRRERPVGTKIGR